MEAYSELLEITGGWIQVLGSGISSIGETIIVGEEDSDADIVGNKLLIIGNGVEATGNSLQAIGRSKSDSNGEGRTIDILGTWMQAVGNSANVASAVLELKGEEEEEEVVKLDLVGDILQSIGATFEAVSSCMSDSEFAQLATTGNSLQALGAAIEAIGAIYLLKNKKKQGEQIQALGSYAQTTGATMVALASTKEYEVKRGIRNSNKFWYD